MLRRCSGLQTPRRCPTHGGLWRCPTRGGLLQRNVKPDRATFLGVALLVARLAGKDALIVAVTLDAALLPFRAFRATFWALEGGGQADGSVDEVSVHLDLRFRRQRESRTFVLLFPVRRLQLRADDVHHVHVSRHRRCMHVHTRNFG